MVGQLKGVTNEGVKVYSSHLRTPCTTLVRMLYRKQRLTGRN